MKRKIIEIDQSKCDGCGQCINSCHEGALALIDGKARLMKDTFCDGLGACIGDCPTGALKIVERDAVDFDAAAVETNRQQQRPSSLGHWPVQLMLVPPHAPFLKGADLLICADCVPFAVPDFHERYLSGRAVVIGCPKLDDLDHYKEKLAAMFREAQPRRLTVARMEVPCCRGIAQAAIGAAKECTSAIPVEEHIVGIGGAIKRVETSIRR